MSGRRYSDRADRGAVLAAISSAAAAARRDTLSAPPATPERGAQGEGGGGGGGGGRGGGEEEEEEEEAAGVEEGGEQRAHEPFYLDVEPKGGWTMTDLVGFPFSSDIDMLHHRWKPSSKQVLIEP